MRYFLFPIVALVLAFTVEARAQDYHVKLSRPDKQGDGYVMSATGSAKLSQTQSIAGGEPQKTDRSIAIKLDGAINILEVKNGRNTKLTCTVLSCFVDDKPAIAAGTVITAENVNGKSVLTIDGKPVDPVLGEALSIVLAAEDPADNIGYDEMFGTGDAKKVGDSWPVDSQAVAKSMSKDSAPVGKDDVKGTVKLTEAKKVNDKDTLAIEAEATANMPPGQIPDGPAFDKAVATMQYSCVVPAAPDGQAISESMSMHIAMHVNTKTPDNQPVSGDITVDRSAKFSYSAK